MNVRITGIITPPRLLRTQTRTAKNIPRFSILQVDGYGTLLILIMHILPIAASMAALLVSPTALDVTNSKRTTAALLRRKQRTYTQGSSVSVLEHAIREVPVSAYTNMIWTKIRT